MENKLNIESEIPYFETMIKENRILKTADTMNVLQLNLGKLCNLTCKHCHVEAGPHRTESMNRNVMKACLDVYKKQGFSTIDITGGAPEMNPDFDWLLSESCKISNHVIVRTNLVILAEKNYQHFIEKYAKEKVELVCSMPYYQSDRVDRVRGNGTFDKSIAVLKELNQVGYGINPDLVLNMVYNPAGAFFPPNQSAMEQEYKQKFDEKFRIHFNHLFTIMNNPVGRFGTFLEKSGNTNEYMKKLYLAFNPSALHGMMCRHQLSVDYKGTLYDCDFNQAIELSLLSSKTIFEMAHLEYRPRSVRFGNHCYACTAGQGSSCGGITE